LSDLVTLFLDNFFLTPLSYSPSGGIEMTYAHHANN